jgi:anionic cell wall polymer biosynthesis LytR-Cps2A-Psr (LCP) family protein
MIMIMIILIIIIIFIIVVIIILIITLLDVFSFFVFSTSHLFPSHKPLTRAQAISLRLLSEVDAKVTGEICGSYRRGSSVHIHMWLDSAKQGQNQAATST